MLWLVYAWMMPAGCIFYSSSRIPDFSPKPLDGHVHALLHTSLV